MWIKFNLDGMKFELKIENYKPGQTLDGDWADVSFNFEFQDIIKYKKTAMEILLCCEVDDLRAFMEDLLNDKLTDIKSYECIEPDFDFIFRPKYDIRNNPNLIYVKPGNEIEDVNMELNVNLWNEGLTCNYFSTLFNRKEIENFYLYLCLITSKIKNDDARIRNLLNSGTIYDSSN